MSGISDTLNDSAKDLRKKADMLVEAAAELSKKSDLLNEAANEIRKQLPESTRDLQKMIPVSVLGFAKNLPDTVEELRTKLPGQQPKKSGPPRLLIIAGIGLLAIASFFAKQKLMAPSDSAPAY